MAVSEPSVPVKHLDDITECAICTNNFTDPRVLPCIHTFCLQCLQGWADKRKPGEDQLACPLCRKQITVTKEQLAELPKNFFVEKLLDVKTLAGEMATGRLLCDLKLCQKGGNNEANKATVYCVECHQNLCEFCSSTHKTIKALNSHRLVAIGSQASTDELLAKFSQQTCEKHSGEVLKLYCGGCKMVVCIMCSITDHKSHDVLDVNEVAGEMSQHLKADIDVVDKKKTEYRKQLEDLAATEKCFEKDVAKTEKAIVERATEVVRLVEKYKNELLTELAAAVRKEAKKMETLKHDLEGRLMMINSFKKYSEQLRQKGSACDIAREAAGLQTRAKELMCLSDGDDLMASHIPPEILFASRTATALIRLIFGKLQLPRDTKPLQILPSTGKPVVGIATFGDELFVVRNEEKHIDVYDIETLILRRQLLLSPDATGINRGLVVCPTNQCAYVSDHRGSKVNKVAIDGKTLATNWPVDGKPIFLSLCANSCILVACYHADKLVTYTPDGVLVHAILFEPSFHPLHAIQLQNGQYGVTHQDDSSNIHRYCVVDDSGQVIKSFGDIKGADENQLYSPGCLAVIGNGLVCIADSCNSRVLLLDPYTFTAKPLYIDGGLNGPWCIHYDKLRGRLYIGEYRGDKRVIVLGKA